MKKLSLVLAFMAATFVATAAEYLVFIERDGVIYFEVTKTKPIKGDGITIMGPFPDGTWTNQAAPVTIAGTAITPSQNVEVTKGDNAGTDLVLLYIAKDKQVKAVKCSNTIAVGNYNYTDPKKIKMSGCEGCGVAIVTKMTVSKEGTVKVNGTTVTLKSAKIEYKPKADSKHGDILIDNVPIEGY